jgi:hypothetical protein
MVKYLFVFIVAFLGALWGLACHMLGLNQLFIHIYTWWDKQPIWWQMLGTATVFCLANIYTFYKLFGKENES